MHQLRATTKSLTFPPLSVARYSFIQLSQLGCQCRERKCPIFETVAKATSFWWRYHLLHDNYIKVDFSQTYYCSKMKTGKTEGKRERYVKTHIPGENTITNVLVKLSTNCINIRTIDNLQGRSNEYWSYSGTETRETTISTGTHASIKHIYIMLIAAIL